MIEHIWSILCSRSVIDSETNNVSIQNIIEQIVIKAEPTENGFLPIDIELITLWGREETDKAEEGIEKVTFVTPSGKSEVISETNIDLTKAERHRQRLKLQGLPISESGRYYFKVETKNDDGNWIQVSSIPLKIIFQSPN